MFWLRLMLNATKDGLTESLTNVDACRALFMAMGALRMPPKSITRPCAKDTNVVLRLTARYGLAFIALESAEDSTAYTMPVLMKPTDDTEDKVKLALGADMSFCTVSLDGLNDVELTGCEKVSIKVPSPAVISRVKLLRDGGMKFAVMLRAWTALVDGMALMGIPEAS